MLVSANWMRARSTFTTLRPGRVVRGSSRSMIRLFSVPKAADAHAATDGDAPSGHAAEIEEVHAQVGRERQRAGQLEAADLADRSPAADHRQRALVEVLEWSLRAGRAVRDPLRDVPRLLDGHRREAGKRPSAGPACEATSPITEISGCPGSAQSEPTSSRPPRSRAAPVASPSTSANPAARTPAAQITVLAAIRSGAPLCSSATPSASIAVARAPSRTSTPSEASSRAGLRRQLRVERGQHPVAGVEQDHARVGRVEAGELALHVVAGEHRQLAGDLDAGRGRRRSPRRSGTAPRWRRRSRARPPRTTRGCARAARRRRSSVFSANDVCCHSSCPKYDVSAPQATIRLS